MFYRHRQHYHAHGLFFIFSLIVAFILGRKSEQYGYTIIARQPSYSNENNDHETDMMEDFKEENSFQQ